MMQQILSPRNSPGQQILPQAILPSNALKHVAQAKSKLQSYVTSINQRVSSLLEKQLLQFLQAQKQVFNRIHNETRTYVDHIARQQQIINKLTNEGDIAVLLREKKSLQAKLYSTTDKLMATSKELIHLKHSIKTLQSQNQRLKQNFKLAAQTQLLTKCSQCKLSVLSPKRHDSLDPRDNKVSTIFLTNNHQSSLSTMRQAIQRYDGVQSTQDLKYKQKYALVEQQLRTLKQKYRKVLNNSMDFVGRSQYQSFFLNCIEKFKARRKMDKTKASQTRQNYMGKHPSKAHNQTFDLSKLSAQDRFEIFGYLLENDRLVAELQSLVFPKSKRDTQVQEADNSLLQSHNMTTFRPYDLPKLDRTHLLRHNIFNK